MRPAIMIGQQVIPPITLQVSPDRVSMIGMEAGSSEVGQVQESRPRQNADGPTPPDQSVWEATPPSLATQRFSLLCGCDATVEEKLVNGR